VVPVTVGGLHLWLPSEDLAVLSDADPGVLVARGEIAGTWRQRRSIATVQPFRKLTAAERRAAGGRAAALDLEIEFAGG
jgi:hypothetical protein